MKSVQITIGKNFIAAIAFICIAAFAVAFTQDEKTYGSHNISDAEKKEVLQVLDNYLSAWNAKNLVAWEATYQFPHYRLAAGTMNVLEKAGLRDSLKVFAPLQQAGWGYSKWDHRNIVQASGNKVHVDTKFSRYKTDGTLIGRYESLYILTKENGRWGIKFRSSYAE